jgi:hypothetical protein
MVLLARHSNIVAISYVFFRKFGDIRGGLAWATSVPAAFSRNQRRKHGYSMTMGKMLTRNAIWLLAEAPLVV